MPAYHREAAGTTGFKELLVGGEECQLNLSQVYNEQILQRNQEPSNVLFHVVMKSIESDF